MLKSYIKPESLSAAEVQQVLEFLNGAQTIEEIADTIELPGELDVGLRVAQRLLNRRATLGGEFSNIQQVADTPYVGPERFTEIVAVLTGRRIEKIWEGGTVPAAVLQELRELREMVRSLRAGMGVRYRISMRLAQAGLYLGQTAIVLVEVYDMKRKRPKANLPLTFATTWGTLETQIGFEKRHGSVVTARTDINGKAKIKIIGPTYEPLTNAQQSALDFALHGLDPAAATPNEAALELNDLVLQYQAKGNVDLRQAMDIYFHTRQEALSTAINRPTSNFEWPYFDALVTAYLHEDEEQVKYGNVAESTAVLKVRIKDWMEPWYQVYINRLNESCTICEDFNRLKDQVTDKGLLLDNMVNRLYSYASVEFGLIGKSAAEKVAQRQVAHFLHTGLDGLPFDTQKILFPALNLAAKNITTRQLGTLAVMGQVRTDITETVNAKFEELGDIGSFMEVVTSVQDRLGIFETNYGQFNADYNQFKIDLEQIDATSAQLQADLAQFETNLTQFNADYNQFQIDIEQLHVAYVELQTDLGQFANDLNAFNAANEAFQADINTFNTNYGSFQTRYNQFTNRYNSFNKDYAEFNDNLSQVDGRLDTFEANFSTFSTKYTDFSQKYDDFIEKDNTINRNFSSINNNLADFNAKYTTFNRNYSSFNNNVTKFNTDLSTFNRDYTKFKEELQSREGPTGPEVRHP
ncbi:MAG: hypothetical protein JW786_06475 [Desulfobacterales bacterium]|nr:hypothetical protein [Desulfobacterales bacterium]